MLKKPCKIITEENGEIKIYGNGHDIEIEYAVPEWNDNLEEEACFKYKGNICFLSEYMRIDNNASNWMKEFDGYSGDSYFSGTLIKLSNSNDAVKVYTYIC